MLRALAHRGPDEEGRLERPEVLLGHRRLKILDLSDNARQPLANETENVFLVFNGEIYNFASLRDELRADGHHFRSRTDAEVVVHGYEAWGIEGTLSRLRGMFAFALADFRAARPIVYLARDRFGIKPLYYGYSTDRDALLFASEVSALAESGLVDAEISEEALAAFLARGSVPAPMTALRGIETLPAAHYWRVDGEADASPKRYWAPPPLDAPKDTEVERDLPGILREAVTSHLVSDVPLGVFLSGGIDSASLVSIAAKERDHPLTTVSVGFDDPDLDERRYARAVASRYGTDHREIVIDRATLERRLPEFWNAMDQPSIDGLNSFVVSRAAREAGLTVVLSGLGGDEVFLGYPHHRSLSRLEPYLPWMRRAPRAMFEMGCRMLHAPPKAEYLHRGGAYWAFRGLFTSSEIEALAPGLDSRHDLTGGDSLASGVRLEFEHYLHNQLLRDADVMSMAHGLEARVPFLDHELVESVLRIPDHRKLARGVNKPLLLRSLPDELPRNVWDRNKQGFTFPVARYLRSPRYREELTHATVETGLFERSAVEKLWNEFASGRAHWSRPWSLASYAVWYRKLKRRTRASASQPEPVAAS